MQNTIKALETLEDNSWNVGQFARRLRLALDGIEKRPGGRTAKIAHLVSRAQEAVTEEDAIRLLRYANDVLVRYRAERFFAAVIPTDTDDSWSEIFLHREEAVSAIEQMAKAVFSDSLFMQEAETLLDSALREIRKYTTTAVDLPFGKIRLLDVGRAEIVLSETENEKE